MTANRIKEIQSIMSDNPEFGRSQLSRHICALWGWMSPDGTLKDIACRDMLRALEKSGAIELPPPKSKSRTIGNKANIKWLYHDTDPIECPLRELLPLQIEIVNSGFPLEEFKSYIDQFHYLKFGLTIGENMKYMIRSCNGIPLACMLFGSAAWSCADRDKYIGWNKEQRSKNLMYLTANTRFLIFPWIRVFCLASHILSIVAKRISSDWEIKYGHYLLALETFVDPRFYGTSYKAGNWIYVGTTTGRGRDGGHHNAILPKKDVYLLPLQKKFQGELRGSA